jgi:CHAD domain-containing protein
MTRAGRRPSPGGSRAESALREHLGRAITDLQGKGASFDDGSVHEARKELKRARAMLRLLRDSIGDAAYRRANRRLRDAGRPLSRVRDAKVSLGVIAELFEDTEKPSRRKQLSALERELHREWQRARCELEAIDLRDVRRTIVSVLSHSRSWTAAGDERLRSGIERMFRKARRAFARADADGSEKTLHESRKQTKYLAVAFDVLAGHRGHVRKQIERAKSIAHRLGDDHDLAVVRKKLRGSRRSGSSCQALVAGIDERREKLQRKALKQGRRLYHRKARRIAAALA